MKSSDYKIAALAGFLTGITLVPTFLNIGFDAKVAGYGVNPKLFFVVLPFLLALAWAIGIWIGKLVAKVHPALYQVAKFAEIGVLNTAINFGVLNLASLITGVTAGFLVGGYNVPGTLIAATNSYFWNKFWVFQKVDGKGMFRDVPKFALVTLVGLIVNSIIIVGFTSYISPMFGLTHAEWLNVGKVLATILGVLVDFIGYKFLVFVRGKK
jgi:putative flippase GtrA